PGVADRSGGEREPVYPRDQFRVQPAESPGAGGNRRAQTQAGRVSPVTRVLLVVGVVLVSLFTGLAVGAVPLAPGDLLRGLADPGSPQADIVRNLRVPRVLLAFLVGGGLGISGAALQ